MIAERLPLAIVACCILQLPGCFATAQGYAPWTPSILSLLANQDTWDGVIATGGTSTNDYEAAGVYYRVHQFLTVGSSALVVTRGGDAEYELRAGGGGSGGTLGNMASGGGGAGGRLTNVGTNALSLVATSYTIVVGAGGSAGAAGGGSAGRGNNGGNSTAFGLTAYGGGGGGSGDNNELPNQIGKNGGSGGGAGGAVGSAGGTGVSGQGSNGQVGNYSTGVLGSGGGASGTGRDGVNSTITGTSTAVSGAGAGFANNTTPLGGSRSNRTIDSGLAAHGAANSGAGGGAIWTSVSGAGRNGGSGAVFVRYRIPYIGWQP
jgi:hypothetical protein